MRAAAPHVLALILVLPALAGCLADDPLTGSDVPATVASLSQPLFDILPAQRLYTAATTDGTPLHTRLWLPDVDGVDPTWKAPVILVMTPYSGHDNREDPLDPASPIENPDYRWVIEHFVPRGYAVAFNDVRGTGDSGGCLEQTAAAQRQDGYDVIEDLAARDWSNGHVGMYGRSYRAETQLGTAALAPPSLTTIVPVASVAGQYEWSFYDGVPFTLQSFSGNFFYLLGDGIQPPTSPEGLAAYPSRLGCHPEMLAHGLDMSGDWDPYWEVRELRHLVHDIEASVLYVHGLQDWNVRPVAVRDMWDHIESPKRLMLGQWAHNFPDGNSFEPSWSRTDWRETVHAWYDHWLLGIDNGIMDELPPVQVQDSRGAWRVEERYPPTDTTPFTLHFSPDGLVAEAHGDLAEPLRFRENEEAFLRAQTGLPVPTASSEPFPEELLLASAPLADDLRFSGWPTITMDVALIDGFYPDPDQEIDAHFAVNLYMLAPDGTETWLNAAYLSARHRDGVDAPKPVPEDEVVTYHLRFHPADTVIPAGYAVKLVLAGSDRATQPEGSFFGALVHGGSVTFPTVARDLSAVGLDVPLGEPCRAVAC